MITTRFFSGPLAAYSSTTTFAPERVGEISEDRSAVVGRDGWCFIYEGSNNYRAAYHDPGIAALGDKWAELIEQRQSMCDTLGVRFVQLIVPNKATLMPENFPEPLGAGITTVLQRLFETAPAANLLCPVEQMRQQGLRESFFRRNDSHLTVAGNAYLVKLILEAAGIDTGDVPIIEICKTSHIGDLGSKFNSPIAEEFYAPRFDTGLLDRSKIEKTHEIVVEGFNGTQQTFHNLCAPIKKTLLVIGNSFFERVPSWGMSPIFAALFEEFNFYWAADFNVELIRTFQPDVVVAQTCERFLTKLPNV
jgi:hypothetical protein